MSVKHSTAADASFSAAGVTAWDAVHTVEDNTLAAAKLAATTTSVLFGRSTAGAGAGEEVAFSTFLTPTQGDAAYDAIGAAAAAEAASQPLDADLTAIAGIANTDGNFIVGTGATWVAESGATARTSLGLGSIATQASNNVTITGGSVTGITDLAVADGGTGGSTAQTARTNLKAGLVFTVTSATGSINPLDGTTYYTGSLGFLSVAGVNIITIPRDGIVKAVYITFVTGGTLGTTETSTVSFRLNNTTDTTISSSTTQDALATHFSNTSLSISVSAGDTFEIKWVTPTWSTNPTTVYFAATIYME